MSLSVKLAVNLLYLKKHLSEAQVTAEATQEKQKHIHTTFIIHHGHWSGSFIFRNSSNCWPTKKTNETHSPTRTQHYETVVVHVLPKEEEPTADNEEKQLFCSGKSFQTNHASRPKDASQQPQKVSPTSCRWPHGKKRRRWHYYIRLWWWWFFVSRTICHAHCRSLLSKLLL